MPAALAVPFGATLTTTRWSPRVAHSIPKKDLRASSWPQALEIHTSQITMEKAILTLHPSELIYIQKIECRLFY
jgi:hypothetical protein